MSQKVAELPSTWQIARIGELCELRNGRAFKPSEWSSAGLPIVRIQNLNNPDAPFNHYESALQDHFLIEHGDLLFAWSGTPGTSFGAHIWRGGRAALNQHIFRVDFDKRTVDKSYFRYAINDRLNELIGKAHGGVGLRHVTKGKFEDTMIPLPPLREQRRIVTKIEELFSELDKGIEALNTSRAQLKAYRQSVLKHAFEGKLTEKWRIANPERRNLLAAIQSERDARYAKGRKSSRIQPERHGSSLAPKMPSTWATEYLGNLNVEVFDGPFGSHLKTNDYVEKGVRVIRLENIGYGRFIGEKQSFVSEAKYEEIKKHTVVPGDIVLSSFVTDAIKSALVPNHIPFAVNKADCFAIRFFGTTISQKFAQFFLNSRNAFKQVEGMIHGVGRPRINTTQLKETVIPICSRKEQDLIIQHIESAFSEVDALEVGIDGDLARLAILRQSILKHAFSGQLVAQDPTDEPSSALLERIRAVRSGAPARTANGKNGLRKNGKKSTA